MAFLASSIGLVFAISACKGGSDIQPGPTSSVSVEVSTGAAITPTPAAEPTLAGPAPSPKSYVLVRALEELDRLTVTERVSGDLILERNERFEIVWMISNRGLMIRVIEPPYDEGRRAVTQWFLDKGFTQEELCALNLKFYPTKQADPNNQFPRDSGPTGCPSPTPSAALTAQYPSRLQELVNKAQEEIAKSGTGWAVIFYNDLVRIVYNPNYQDYLGGPTYPAFIVYYRGDRGQAEGIVGDVFQGFGTDVSVLAIHWSPVGP
jgi:hypothetical protein